MGELSVVWRGKLTAQLAQSDAIRKKELDLQEQELGALLDSERAAHEETVGVLTGLREELRDEEVPQQPFCMIGLLT